MSVREINIETGLETTRPYTAAELEAISAYPLPSLKEQLVALDQDYPLTQRNLRQAFLLLSEALKLGGPVDLTVIPGIRDVAAVEARAEELREALRAQQP